MVGIGNFVTDSENHLIFVIQLSLSIIAVATNFVAFVSPYWIESKSGSYALFNRIGLWTVCFDGYMRPNMYDKAYFGCFYIYYVEYDAIRDWLNPWWLYGVQVISSLGLIVHTLVLFFVLCQAMGRIKIECRGTTKWLMAGHFVSGFALVITIIGFTFGSFDSRWVPYPRFNKLSWAYAMALISVMFTISAFFTFLVFYLKINAKKSSKSFLDEPDLDDVDDENENDEIQKLSQKQYSRAGDTASVPLRPPVTPDTAAPDEIHEDLGEDLDENSNSVYPYSQHFRV